MIIFIACYAAIGALVFPISYIMQRRYYTRKYPGIRWDMEAMAASLGIAFLEAVGWPYMFIIRSLILR